MIYSASLASSESRLPSLLLLVEELLSDSVSESLSLLSEELEFPLLNLELIRRK